MKAIYIVIVVLFSFSIVFVSAQTPEQQKIIDKALRMHDSLLNTKEVQDAMRLVEQINAQYEEFQKKSQQGEEDAKPIEKKDNPAKVQSVIDRDNNISNPGNNSSNSRVQGSLLNLNVGYSAISSLQAKNPGSTGSYKSVLKIYQAPDMMRFEDPEKISVPIVIFRYDKDIIWVVHHEQPQYKGVKLYQEFELQNGRGMSSHIDNIVSVMLDLKNPKNLKNMGKEMIDGHMCTRYRKENVLSWEPAPDNVVVYDYWINKDKILIKMSYTGPDVSGTLETKNIRLSSQTENLFVPPSDFKKAGNIITWKEEKQKFDTKKTALNKQLII